MIADLLGVPGEDQPSFRHWAEALLGDAAAPDSPTIPDEQQIAAMFDAMIPAINEMNAYLLDQIKQRRQHPTTDLIGLLVAAETDGQRLTASEIVGFAATLLLAGHVTTATGGRVAHLTYRGARASTWCDTQRRHHRRPPR